MFPVNGALLAKHHLPSIGAQFRRHQYDEDFRSRFWFAPRALAIPPWFVRAEASTPGWRGAASGQDHCSAGDPVTGAFASGRERDLSGSQAIHPVPLLRSATPAEPTIPHPWRVSSGLPLLHRQQRLQRAIDIGATAGLRHLQSMLHERCCHYPCKTSFRSAG